jgi:ubiquinone biosynthesis protein
MVFEDGLFHADPHPGNFFVAPDGSLAVIDFGMVGELTEVLRVQLVELLINLLRGDLAGTAGALLNLVRHPPDVDREALESDLGPVVERFGGVSLAELALTGLISEVLAITRRYQLTLPHDLALLFKMLLMAEGLGLRLDPDFELARVLAPYAERLALRRHSPDAVADRIIHVARELLEAGSQAPQSLRGLAQVLERGGFDVHLGADELQEIVREGHRIGNRVVAGVIAAALIEAVGRAVGGEAGGWKAWRGPLAAAGAGSLGVLVTSLVRGSLRDRQALRPRRSLPGGGRRRASPDRH